MPRSTYQPADYAAPGSADELIYELRHELLALRESVPALQAARRADVAEIRRLEGALARAEHALANLRASYASLAAEAHPDGFTDIDREELRSDVEAELAADERAAEAEDRQWWEQMH